MADGPAANRPPHRLLAVGAAFDGVGLEEELLMTAAPIAYPCRARSTRIAGIALATLALALFSVPGRADADTIKPGELNETKPPQPVPELNLTDLAAEQPTSLAAYKGKPMVINLWATWCAPCVKEMPSLVRLSNAMKDRGLAVVFISEDRGGKFVVDPFLKEHNIVGQTIFLDKRMESGKALKATSALPVTLLIDAEGREVGRVFGEREWDSAESQAELTKLFGLKKAG